MAEWSGKGLQNPLQRFDSAPDLQGEKKPSKGFREGFAATAVLAISAARTGNGAADLVIRRGAAVAQRTVNPLVVGSNPTAGAKTSTFPAAADGAKLCSLSCPPPEPILPVV